MEKEIRLRYLEVDGEMMRAIILAEVLAKEQVEEVKRKALEKLGIRLRDGEKPSDAWLRAMCEENGFEFGKPVPPEIAEAITNSANVYRFYFWLV